MRSAIPAADSPNVKRRGLISGKSPETNAPRARWLTIHPSATSSSNAATTVIRCTPSTLADDRVPGKASPGRNLPRRMSVVIAPAICRNSGTPRRRSTAEATSHRAMPKLYREQVELD